MSIFKNKIIIYAAHIGIFSLLCISMLGLANPGHAAADTYKSDRDCTDSSTEFNVVFVARVYDYQGNLKGFADNYNFHVHAKEVWLSYADWSGWSNLKPAGYDIYDSKHDTVGGGKDDTSWRGANWVHYTSDQGDMGYPTGHDVYSNETKEWMKLKSEAIRLWDGGRYYKTGVNADFSVAMNKNFSGTTAADDGMAYAAGNACKVPDGGGRMAPAYAFRDGDNTCHVGLTTANGLSSGSWVGTCNLGHDLNNHSWSLSCLGGNDTNSPGSAIDNMWFDFSMNSWNGYYVTSAWNYTSQVKAATGGAWTTYSIKAANTQSRYVYLDYHEPTPPTPPTMSPQGNINNVEPSADSQGYIEPGDSFTASGSVTATASTLGGSANATWRVWYDTDQNFATNTPSSNPPLLRNQTVNLTFGAAGGLQYIGSLAPTQLDYTLADTYSWICSEVVINSVGGSPAPNVANNPNKRCLHIERRPYVKVVNGDINAASKYGSSCLGSGNATISAFNKGPLGSFAGSGTNIAALAGGVITEFTSGKPAKGLSFANTGTTGVYGGSFQAGDCLPDFGTAALTTTGDVTVDASSGTVVTDGNAYISQNYSSASSFNINSIPLRWVVAKNIYIDKNVTSLDGNYIARENVYTCASAPNTPVPIASMAASCKTQLVINGTLTAGKAVKLQRTYGALNNALPPVPAPPQDMTYSSAVVTCPAGKTRLQLIEAGDPGTWNDNYICVSSADVAAMGGMFWTMNVNNPGAAAPDGVAGRTIDASHCAFMTSANVGDSYGPGYWYDNAICSQNPYGLEFSSVAIPSKKCVRIMETADPHNSGWWATTGIWFCYGLPPTPPVSAVGAAEQINFSPEVWIQATRPNFTYFPSNFGSTLGKFDAITLLPPVL